MSKTKDIFDSVDSLTNKLPKTMNGVDTFLSTIVDVFICLTTPIRMLKICVDAKYDKFVKSVNKKMVNEFKNDSENLENKCNYLKNIIGEMNRENFDNKTKLFLIDKINELQIDFINKISSLEKKYKTQNDNNKKKINKLEKENNDLRKKVIKIKSIV